MHAYRNAFADIFRLTHAGFEREKITARFAVGEEGGVQCRLANFRRDFYRAKAFGEMLGEGFDIGRHRLWNSHHMPAGFGGRKNPDLIFKCEVQLEHYGAYIV